MAKKADVYFGGADFTIVEEGFDPGHSLVAESVFALANEYMGVRGYIDEGMGEKSLRGTYLNGVYELDGEEGPGGYKGIIKQTHYMVTCADMFYLKFSLPDMECISFSRMLDMRTGLLTRAVEYRTGVGTLRVKVERLLSMQRKEIAAQRITLESDAPMRLALTLGIDGTVKHQGGNRNRWQPIEKSERAFSLQTETTGQRLSYAYRTVPEGKPLPCEDKQALGEIAVTLMPGTPVIIEKANAVLRDADMARAQALVENAPSFDTLLAENRAHYDAFWHISDVEIGGDAFNQQGIRFCLFQLHQTYRGLAPGSNIGAKGLTGEAYNGHAFWDTETYCLAQYLFADPKAAKNLLLYRYHTLPQAKERARQLDLQGACYPIATLNGKEACALWQHASLQMQPSTAVAYAIEYYAQVTGDMDFLYREGAEMLVEIARYCASRGAWNQDHTGYGYYGVMGPDEFHLMVNNNFYTNFMGRKALLFALKMLEALPQADVVRLGVTDAERANWRAMADGMILTKRPDGVYPQHEGYCELPHLDIHSIPQSEFPLYHHWSYDRIYRTDMIKQPDVLMAIFLHPGDFNIEEIAANYDFYEPRCIHESSLSPSIHSVIASWLSRPEEAYRFFGFATRLDLDNYNNNTGEGLHTTSLAAAWITLIYGFAGLKTDGGAISLAPALPKEWTDLRFTLLACGSRIRVEMTHAGTALTLVSGPPCQIDLAGKKVWVR